MAENSDDLQETRYLEVLNKINLLISPKSELGKKDPIQVWDDNVADYLEALELSQSLSKLSVIHVAGTKGKGSTCAMVDGILQACGYTTGRFTSPHLHDIRERICICGKWVDKSLFTREAEWCLARLKGLGLPLPSFFRFMTLLAFRVFSQANLDAVILEVGLGGRLDSTNIIRNPVVCGITMLGFDHMEILGYTLREISAEKAGIFKKGSPAFTVCQKEEALATLKEKADETGVSLSLVKPLSAYSNAGDVVSKLCGSYQAQNAALAVALACEWERRQKKTTHLVSSSSARCWEMDQDYLPDKYKSHLIAFKWPGRNQILDDTSSAAGYLRFYLDGAHTVESMELCGQWFARENTIENAINVLWFNCTGDRNYYELLVPLQRALIGQNCTIQHAIFAPLDSSKFTCTPSKSTTPIDLSVQIAQRDAWKQVTREFPRRSVVPKFPTSQYSLPSVQPSLTTALSSLRKVAKANPSHPLRVLVTGSLYLVGDVLKLIEAKSP